jgi:hypothetical protein
MSAHEHAIKARQAASHLLAVTEQARVAALNAIADALRKESDALVAENAKDLMRAAERQLSEALTDRLRLTPQRVADMAAAVESIAKQPDVLGIHEGPVERSDGLQIIRQRIPLGVVAIIFESRPNVVVDCAALAIKSGNAVILKGGREAMASNAALGRVITEATGNWPKNYSRRQASSIWLSRAEAPGSSNTCRNIRVYQWLPTTAASVTCMSTVQQTWPRLRLLRSIPNASAPGCAMPLRLCWSIER